MQSIISVGADVKVLKNKKLKTVFEYIGREGVCVAGEISSLFGWPMSSVDGHLKALVESGLIVPQTYSIAGPIYSLSKEGLKLKRAVDGGCGYEDFYYHRW